MAGLSSYPHKYIDPIEFFSNNKSNKKKGKNWEFNNYSIFIDKNNQLTIGGSKCGVNPNNILKYKRGERFYYLKNIEYINGSNEVIFNLIATHDKKEYHNILPYNENFNSKFTFVPFDELPDVDQNPLKKENNIEYHSKIFEYHDVVKQNKIVNELVENMRVSTKEEMNKKLNDQPIFISGVDFNNASAVNRDYINNQLWDSAKDFSELSNLDQKNIFKDFQKEMLNKIPTTMGIPSNYFTTNDIVRDSSGSIIKNRHGAIDDKKDDTIIIKMSKKRKQIKPTILPVDQIMGLPKELSKKINSKPKKTQSDSLSGVCIGNSITTGNINDLSISIGSSAGINGIKYNDTKIIPHNGIKYNDKISIDEEKCVILKRKNKL